MRKYKVGLLLMVLLEIAAFGAFNWSFNRASTVLIKVELAPILMGASFLLMFPLSYFWMMVKNPRLREEQIIRVTSK